MGDGSREEFREMALTVEDLRLIATQLDKVREVKLHLTGELRVRDHLVRVRWEDDPHDGAWPVITEIRRAW